MPTPPPWDPQDPRGDDPEAGKDGHFDHHLWLKEFALQANADIAALKARVDELENP